MKKLSKRLLAALLTAVLLVGLVPALAAEGGHTIWVVGDSTGCHYGADSDVNYYYKRVGYGDMIGEYLTSGYTVKNIALSGYSSKSFLAHNNYTTLKSGIKAGDILIIGFGHNDEKTDAERFTSPIGNYQTEGSFAKSLYDNYVKLAKDKGATPVLCTSIVRHHGVGKDWGNNSLHVANGGSYPQAVIDLGTDTNTAVVDLTALTKALYEQLDAAEANSSTKLHAWTQDRMDTMDTTHINKYGAKWVAYTLAKDIVNSTDPNVSSELKAAFTLAAGEPTAADLADAATPGWTAPEYAPPKLPDEKSKIWPNYVVDGTTFYGTAFGSLGGAPTKANYTMGTDEQGNMQFTIKKQKGKVASAEEGFLMYFVPVPAGKSFTLRAKATFNGFVEGATHPEQAAFGLMARDAIWIDKNDKGCISDYVAAGTLGDGSANCFRRKAGKLETPETLGVAPVAGQSYDLSLEGTADGYTCTFGDNAAQSGGYDFALTTKDSQYVYVGMFVARSMSVTFSDISLVITDGTGGDTPDNPPDNPDNPPDDPDKPTVTGMVAGGGLETLFAELPGVADADVTAVKWAGAMTGELKGDDLTYLVRDAQGGVRVDVPGLKAGKYDLTVTVKGQDYVAKGIEVKAHDRSGFAHQTVAENGACTPYTEGVGAYNDDGTLKDNALVLYVTDANKDTVSVKFNRGSDEKTVTGIGNILNSNNSKVNQGFLEYWSREYKRPLVVRFLGTVNQPEGVSAFKAGSSNGGMVYMLSGSNITLEGIGPDATIQGWGISFGADKDDAQYNKQARNFEARNLTFKEVPEDCLEITGFPNEDGSIKEPVEHAWVHNCAFYRPSDIANPAEADKKQGDGALDFKSGLYMTSSYNYFDTNHKTSLVGSADKIQQYHVTWHHNHWKNVETRAPLARQANMHIYNNIYEGQSGYCMSLRANSYVFSEYNAFPGSKNPVKLEATSGETPALPVGACKSYEDDFSGATGQNDATIVTPDKTQKVDSTNKYANFDTAAGSYIAKGDYKLDTTVAAAQANIAAYGGVMKAAADMTTVPLEPAVTETVSKDALTAAVAKAEKAIDVYTVEDDTLTSDVNSGVKFITKTAKAKYQAAIDAAKAVAENTAATQAEVNKAVTDLATATTAFNRALQTGTKGGSTSSGGSSSRPSSRPTTDTTTTPDGTTVTTETTSSGTTTTAVAPDGSKTETVKKPNGDVSVTATDKNGEVVAQVTLPASIPAPETKFEDVPEGHWAEKSINDMAGLGMVKGVSENTYDMTSPITRGSIATIFYRLSNGKAGKTASFADVAADSWYADAVGWAAGAGVVSGYSETAFGPDDTITRQQLAVMIARYAKLLGLDTTADATALSAFTDGSATDTWAVDGMAWCVKTGVMKGRGDGTVDPTAPITRAEAAVMMDRMIGLIK